MAEIESKKRIMEIPTRWSSKAERRHYEKRAKRLERFLISLYKITNKSVRELEKTYPIKVE